MTKPDDKTLKALANLKNDPDFNAVIEWLKKRHDNTVSLMIEAAEEYRLRQFQGRIAELKEVLFYSENSRNIIENIKARVDYEKEMEKGY